MIIKTDYSVAFNYARMQNGILAVRSVAIKNTEKEDIRNVHLTIRFDPDVSDGYESTISQIGPRRKVILDDIDIQFSPSFLANLTERIQGTMTVNCEAEGTAPVKEVYPFILQPYDFWEGIDSGVELVASFVLPNHPAIRPFMQRAAEKLVQWKGNRSLDGYQTGSPDAVKEQVAAIYAALSDAGIAYANPPATFTEQGQRIRLPEDILSGGIATCLDAALLFAGCLEAAGLRPLVIFNENHAYAGCWLVENNSPYPVYDDAAILRKGSAKGINQILLVETTGFLKGCSLSFDEAVAHASASILDKDNFILFADVRAARNMGILPLPLRVLTSTGYVIDSETVCSVRVPGRLGSTDDIDINKPVRVDKHTIWERKLLDLSLRNDLINIHPKDGIIQLASAASENVAAILEDGASFDVYGIPSGWSGAMDEGGLYREIAPNDPMYSFVINETRDIRLHSYKEEEETISQLCGISKEAGRFLEESGANTLYLTVGALKWLDEDGKRHVAPILLYPVETPRNARTFKWTGEDVMVNLTLLEMLRQSHSITVPGLETLPEENGHIDARRVMNTIRRAVMDKKGWDVEDLMFFGVFSFNKFIIWNDIHAHWKMLDSHPAVSSFIEGRLKLKDVLPPEGPVDDMCPAASVLQPISADSSQLLAIRDAVAGRSFVMHGPPGTGKSQTITNIIANALYCRKRVLFVSAKKAALDVVQKRLEEIGLDPFCLELHSNKARKSVVLSKFERILSISEDCAPDTFPKDAKKMDEERNILNCHAKAVNRIYPAGLSLYDCISRYIAFPAALGTRRIPAQIIEGLGKPALREMRAAVCDYVTAIRQTGIGHDCKLFDLPVTEYSPELKERLAIRFDEVSGKPALRSWLSARKLEKEIGAPIGAGLSTKARNTVLEKVVRWRGQIDNLKMYVIYSKQKARLCAMGLGFIPDEFESGRVVADDLEAFFQKSLYRSYARHIIGREKGLGIFCGKLFESFIEKFREDDIAFRETTRRQLYARISSYLPGPDDPLYSGKEMTILKKAIRNNARGVSLRRLFEQIPHLLPRLCPCMLMSPLSVSQYLQPTGEQFDLVIFDEASQLPTSEAVASIARGKAVIVVGDPKQLPPTSFFEKDVFDEKNADKEDMESVLDDCLALSMPSVHLKWHYRSRHESLIAFSNVNYYDNSLLTFPSNDDLSTRVSFHYVNGIYDRGRTRTNEAEAAAVVQEVKRRLSNPSEQAKSIGIITFNVSQQDLIEKKLESLFAGNKALARVAGKHEEPLFVKSLENVQGDERDLILFSVGYGSDKKGRVSMNFGPLNHDGGWRRLNVAVSRARQEMMVFSSIQPEQISSDWFVPRGVLDLKAFLKYARDGRESLDIPPAANGSDDRFAEKIAEELRAKGLTVNTGVGSSDFRVDVAVVDTENPGNYLYGILLDGPCYESADSARDREIIRPQVLKDLGWTIKRDWILDRYDE